MDLKRYIPILYFQKKIAVPALAISVVLASIALGISFEAFLTSIGIAYLLFAFFMHYIIYEIRNPNEYYFYYNLGFSKRFLWLSTIVTSGVILLIFLLL